MRALIPNLITLLNLFFGCCAMLFVLNGRPDVALWFILGCFACDSADGLIARILGVSGPLGKQLDSLADAVSFGVVPGMMLYAVLAQAGEQSIPGEILGTLGGKQVVTGALPAFVLSMFAAYRLGKFNIDTRQTSYFLGLSTPGTTIFVLGLALSAYYNRLGTADFLRDHLWVVYLIIATLSFLMVSEIPLAGMKVHVNDWKANLPLLSFLALFLLLLFFVKELAFCLIIVAYIAYSILFRKTFTS